jgi:hypothetical protein
MWRQAIALAAPLAAALACIADAAQAIECSKSHPPGWDCNQIGQASTTTRLARRPIRFPAARS